jgi:hypothetical protein
MELTQLKEMNPSAAIAAPFNKVLNTVRYRSLRRSAALLHRAG